MITHFETTKKAYLAIFQKHNESHESSKFKALVLCQDLVQIKMGDFSS